MPAPEMKIDLGPTWSGDTRFQKSEKPTGHISTYADGSKHQKQADGTWKEMTNSKPKETKEEKEPESTQKKIMTIRHHSNGGMTIRSMDEKHAVTLARRSGGDYTIAYHNIETGKTTSKEVDVDKYHDEWESKGKPGDNKTSAGYIRDKAQEEAKAIAKEAFARAGSKDSKKRESSKEKPYDSTSLALKRYQLEMEKEKIIDKIKEVKAKQKQVGNITEEIQYERSLEALDSKLGAVNKEIKTLTETHETGMERNKILNAKAVRLESGWWTIQTSNAKESLNSLGDWDHPRYAKVFDSKGDAENAIEKLKLSEDK